MNQNLTSGRKKRKKMSRKLQNSEPCMIQSEWLQNNSERCGKHCISSYILEWQQADKAYSCQQNVFSSHLLNCAGFKLHSCGKVASLWRQKTFELRGIPDYAGKTVPRELIPVMCFPGDQYQGTLWFYVHKGNAAAHFMNRAGYDAMVSCVLFEATLKILFP